MRMMKRKIQKLRMKKKLWYTLSSTKKEENGGDDIIINKEDLILNLNINKSNKKNDIKIINNKYISNDDNISTDKYKQK